MIGKLKNLLAISGLVTNVVLLDRFLSGVTNVIALIVIAGLMAGFFLVGGLCAIYLGMVHYGMEPAVAMIIVATTALLITAVLGTIALLKLRDLRKLSHYIMHPDLHLPGLSQISHMATAFIDGWVSPVSDTLKR